MTEVKWFPRQMWPAACSAMASTSRHHFSTFIFSLFMSYYLSLSFSEKDFIKSTRTIEIWVIHFCENTTFCGHANICFKTSSVQLLTSISNLILYLCNMSSILQLSWWESFFVYILLTHQLSEERTLPTWLACYIWPCPETPSVRSSPQLSVTCGDWEHST